jgi:hypothetical protein
MALHPEFISACRGSLREIFSIWLSVDPVDLRRVLRPTGPGSHSISIEAYRGSRTWMQFDRQLESSEHYKELSRAITAYQPELGYNLVLPGRAISLSNPASLVSTWCRFLEERTPDGSAADQNIEMLLAALATALGSRTLTESAVTVFAGVQLPSTDTVIELAPSARLRSLSEQELIDIGSEDVTFGHGHGLLMHSVSSCFEVNRSCAFSLEPKHPDALLAPQEIQVNGVSASSVLRALHVLKGGRAGAFLVKTEWQPKVLPYLEGGSSWPLQRPNFAGLTLEGGEVAAFITLERELRESQRDELRIAADRLLDAENRLSKVDALLDAVIGLEVLLNPMDASELAFRVALNYAFLGPAEHRRERYERVRLIQKTRNRVVHGGLNTQSADAATLHEHAALAIACLRDALKSFLLDDGLRGNRKLDANFWLDRLFPTTLASESHLLSMGRAGDAG